VEIGEFTAYADTGSHALRLIRRCRSVLGAAGRRGLRRRREGEVVEVEVGGVNRRRCAANCLVGTTE
jgi:hypothetical protein